MEQLRKGLYRDTAGRVRDPFGRFSPAETVPSDPEVQFQLFSFGQARGPLRSSYDQAMTDAIRGGLASWDQERREHYLSVPVEIRRTERKAERSA